MSASLYPLFLDLRDRTCVIVGGSKMAEVKTRELLRGGARVRLIAPAVTEQLAAWVDAGELEWESRTYEEGDLRDAFLVVSVADAVTNARVFANADAQHTFCNAVDDTPHCSGYASAVVRRGPLQIAISTAGNSPALAQRLRKELEGQFGEEYGLWVQQLGETRSRLFEDKTLDSETRRKLLHDQASPGAFEEFRASRRCRDRS
jgi:precorrin-2 dehydrogenase / sirohydrochlorin ferrochelatase